MFLVLVNQFFHIKNGKFYRFTTIFLTAVSLRNKKTPDYYFRSFVKG